MMGEETKYYAGVEVNVIDGRYYFNISAQNGLDMDAIRSILAGGLSLTILSEKTPEKQGQALRGVVDYLESELVNVDSFTDIGGPAVPKI